MTFRVATVRDRSEWAATCLSRWFKGKQSQQNAWYDVRALLNKKKGDLYSIFRSSGISDIQTYKKIGKGETEKRTNRHHKSCEFDTHSTQLQRAWKMCFIYIALSLLCCSVSAAPANPDAPLNRPSRIVNGQEVPEGQHNKKKITYEIFSPQFFFQSILSKQKWSSLINFQFIRRGA